MTTTSTVESGRVARDEGREVSLSEGTVAMSDGKQWVIRLAERGPRANVVAVRAVSCLVDPEPNDRVLVSLGVDENFILAVLTRSSGAPVRVSSEGDITFVARNGRVQVAGDHGVSLASAETVSVVSRDLQVQTIHGRLTFEDFGVVGRALEAKLGVVKTCADAMERVAVRVVNRVKRAYRFVEDVDQLRAGRIDQRAEGLMTLRAEHAVVAAEKLVKMDGGQVHIG